MSEYIDLCINRYVFPMSNFCLSFLLYICVLSVYVSRICVSFLSVQDLQDADDALRGVDVEEAVLLVVIAFVSAL